MTKITKSNVDAAMRDDAAHIDYLKRDVLDDQKYGGKYKDENQTADEKHISKLAGDIKHDMKDKSFLSKHYVHNRVFSHPSPHEGGPEMFSHDWGGESVEMQDQGDSPLEYNPLLSTESWAGKGGQKSEPAQTKKNPDGTVSANPEGGQTLDTTVE
tara:strand:- start:51 stop:518 length:468 start_codon:yes stop_codon:yes gene_type:complete